MKRFCTGFAVAVVVAFGGGALILPARAAPPTVTPSPGYDARLREQRAAATVYEPVVRRRVKRTRRSVH